MDRKMVNSFFIPPKKVIDIMKGKFSRFEIVDDPNFIETGCPTKLSTLDATKGFQTGLKGKKMGN